MTRYNILENPTGVVDSYGNPAHSLSCVVEGGLDADVAQAIYANRGIGPYTNGSTTVTVTGKNGNVMPIRFSRPTYEPVFVSLSVHPLTNYTSDTTTAIENSLVSYLNSLQIGELVVLSELYGATLEVRPNPEVPMFSIKALTMGLTASPTGTADLAMLYTQVSSGHPRQCRSHTGLKNETQSGFQTGRTETMSGLSHRLRHGRVWRHSWRRAWS